MKNGESSTPDAPRKRLLMRKDGNLELILNTLILPHLPAKLGGEKGVIFSAAASEEEEEGGEEGDGENQGKGKTVTHLVKLRTKAQAESLLSHLAPAKGE
mmetsp:Transcript_40115/g.62655  ORF Transcript_40115/g.62655 Transcript_40115/m.62655 type:complete len:100 (-) Transcript_40115:188-487(-)